MAGIGTRVEWKAEQFTENLQEMLVDGITDFALVVEGNSKHELRKGHGVITGTLRRSIHAAEPGYAWSSDDVEPASGTPELGGKRVLALVKDDGNIAIWVGSGLKYALWVHQGHHSFAGYHFIANGLEKAKGDMMKILKRRVKLGKR